MRIENADKASTPSAFIWLTLAEAVELRDALDDLLREPRSDWHAHVSSSDYQTEVTVAFDAGQVAFAPDRYAPFASVGRRLGLYAYGWLVPDESPPPSFRQLSLPPSSHTHGAIVGSRRVDQDVPFLDLVVDGVPLRKMVQEVGFGDDFVTLLSPRWYRAAVQTAIGRFLNGHGEPGEHVDMLVCSVCADRDCGAVLADVTLTDEAVSWSNWRWANWDSEAERRLALPTMRFQRSAYEEVLAGALAALAALPYEDVFPPRKAVSPPWRWGWRLPRRKP